MSEMRLPTVQEELNRKSITALEELLSKQANGKIDAAQLDVGLDVLFNTVSGLVSGEFLELISLAGKEMRAMDCSHVRRHMFARGDEVVVLEHRVGDATVTVKFGPIVEGKWRKVARKSFEEETIPEQAATRHLERVIKNLKGLGYEEV